MKIKNLKKLFATTILSICFIVSIIPTVGAVSDDAVTEATVASKKIEIVDSAATLFHTLGGDEVATLNNNIVTLNNDVDLTHHIAIHSGDIILDLNGHSIYKHTDITGYVFSIDEEVKLTINDATNSGSIEDECCFAYAIKQNGGSLTINGGNIYQIISWDGKLTINSGNILISSTSHSHALNINDNCNIVVNSGSIEGICVSGGNLVINSGDIFPGNVVSSLKIENGSGYVVVNGGSVHGRYGIGILVNEGNKLIINDGSIEGSVIGVQSNSMSIVEITGGKICGGRTGINLYSSQASISGGSFESTYSSKGNAIFCSKAIVNIIKDGCKVVDKDGNDIDVSEARFIKGFAKVI